MRTTDDLPRSIDGRATNHDDPLVTVNIVYRRKVIAWRMIDKEWTILPLLPLYHIYIYIYGRNCERVVIQREKEREREKKKFTEQ